MGGPAFLHAGINVTPGSIGGIPGGSPEQKPVPTGALKEGHVVAIPAPRHFQAAVQAPELAAEQHCHAGFAHAVPADLFPASGQGFGQVYLHREVAPLPALIRVHHLGAADRGVAVNVIQAVQPPLAHHPGTEVVAERVRHGFRSRQRLRHPFHQGIRAFPHVTQRPVQRKLSQARMDQVPEQEILLRRPVRPLSRDGLDHFPGRGTFGYESMGGSTVG